MADYVPPSGPPPPKVPEGWKAVWNDQYKEWFYVNIYTKESTWEKPTAPATHGDDGRPSGPPPGYSTGPNDPVITGDTKRPLDSNNPYQSGRKSSGETDAQLAARLQAEENSKASTDRGAADDYYAQSQQYPPRPAGYDQQSGSNQGQVYGQGYGQGQGQYQGPGQGQYQGPQNPPPGQTASGNKGLFSKLMGKSSKPAGGYGQQNYGPPPQQGYGGPPQGYGYGQQPAYGPPPGQYGGYSSAQPQRKHGMGALGAGALGLGGGLLGGMLLEDAIDGGDHGGDGGDDGGYGGDDGGYGGDDGGYGGDGGGDFGGDGGGDF